MNTPSVADLAQNNVRVLFLKYSLLRMLGTCSMLPSHTMGVSEISLLPLRRTERGPKAISCQSEHRLWRGSDLSEALLWTANLTSTLKMLRDLPHKRGHQPRRTLLIKRRSSLLSRTLCLVAQLSAQKTTELPWSRQKGK